VTISGTSSTVNSVTVTFTVDNGGAAATCAIAIAPSGQSATGCGGKTTFQNLAAGTTYTVTVKATNSVGSGSAAAKRATPQSFGARVTCVDKPSNPDPVYCTATGGIGVFRNLTTTNEDHRVRAGTKFTVTCKQSDREIYAYVYNNNKRSSIWLKMTDGFWIPWAWSTLDNGDKVSAVPTC
jgi:hypothetical protein